MLRPCARRAARRRRRCRGAGRTAPPPAPGSAAARRRVGQDDEVVAGAVALGRTARPSHHAPQPPASADAHRQVGRRPSSQTIRGSRRNHERCRRTNRRVARTVSARAAASACSRRPGTRQHLLVAQGPAGGPPVAQPGAHQRRTSSTQPGGPHLRPPARRSARPARPVSRSTPSWTDAVVRASARAARRRTGPGQLDHLQRAHDPPAVGWAGSARPRPGPVARSRACSGAGPTCGQLRLQLGPAAAGRCRGTRTPPAPRGRTARSRPTSSGYPAAGQRCRRSRRGPAPGTPRRWPARSRPRCRGRGAARRPLGRGQLGGADVHAPVELHRVGVDHLAAERVRQREAQRRSCRPRSARRPRRRSADIRHGGVQLGRRSTRRRTAPRRSDSSPRQLTAAAAAAAGEHLPRRAARPTQQLVRRAPGPAPSRASGSRVGERAPRPRRRTGRARGSS